MAVNLYSLPKILSVDHKAEPTWASDAGRNSNSGKYSGTFIGYFDNLEISVGQTTQEEFDTICSAIEVPIIEDVTFKDTRNHYNNKTEDFYGTTISGKKSKVNGLYKPFSFSLIAIERRNDM